MRFGTLVGVVCLLVATVTGFWTAAQSWKGTIYVTSSYLSDANRDPAAVNKKIDFSVHEGLDFLMASKDRLLTAAKMIVREEDVGVEFGHFLVEGADGKRRPACRSYYSWIVLRFEADGVAESGLKPGFEVESPCLQQEDDFSRLMPVWIPHERILNESPSNHLEWSDPNQRDVRFRFFNMMSEWPTNWVLTSVVLSKEKPTPSGRYYGHFFDETSEGNNQAEEVEADDTPETMVFTRPQIRELLTNPIVLRW